MAAPVAAARSTPLGIFMDDGHSTKVAFSLDPDISLWEKTVTPPGIETGDPVDTSTMHNTVWRTFAERALKTLTPMTFTAAYDPDAYDEVLAIAGTNGTITVHFPDLSTLAFFGILQNFQPGEHSEGAQPEATCTITPTNYDPVNNVEAGPVMTEIAGT